MKKKNMKTMITRILACALLVATLGLSLASCAVKDKVKDAAGKAWDTAVDGAEKIYDKAKDSMAFEQTSGMAAIRLLSDMETDESAAVPTYAGTLTAQDFVGNWTNTQAKNALYVQSKERVGSIVSVTGATIGDYWSVEPGEKPIVAIDGNNSMISILLPAGYTDVATWAAAATDFSITVTPVMEKTLRAYVSPASAPDKSVTWSVSATEEGVDASEYIRLLTFDGAAENKVTVLALKPFAGHEFRIVCKTNVGGLTAECKVTYEGRPEYVSFHLHNDDGTDTYISDVVTLKSGATYSIKTALDNAFHDVSDKSGTYEIKEITVEGTIKVERYQYNTSKHWVQETIDEYDISSYASKFVSATIKDGVLSVNVENAFESFIGNSKGGPSAGEYDRFAGYNGSGKPSINITVRDTVSGLENTLRFHIENTVESVTLLTTTLTF